MHEKGKKRAGFQIFGQLTSQFCKTVVTLMLNCFAMYMIKSLLERSAFGVCSYLGEKIGVASARVRLYFIYLSFAALGSPIIFYLFVAFWLNVKRYIKKKRSLVWE